MAKISKRDLSRAAALMARAGAEALHGSLTPEEESARGKKAARARWKGHEYSSSPQAVKMRKRRKAERRAA